MNPFKGVMPAVTTKFTEDNSLDIDLFKLNIQAQKDAGVHGIILGGTLGEASTLKTEEKMELIRATKQIVGKELPVIMNIAAGSTEEAISSAKMAEAEGVDGFMLLPPMRYKADGDETVAFFKDIAASTELPIMIYNNPVDYGIEVSLEMFDELAEHCPNVLAVKESTRDVSNVTRMINRFGDRFSILCGVDTLAMEELLMGADGWVAGLVCAFPKETVAIYEAVKTEDFQAIKKAREIYRWFLPLLELDINPKLVQNIKLAEYHTGIGSPMVRAPRKALEGKELEEVTEIIKTGIANRPKL